MKTKTIYHLDADCNLVKTEKRTTLLGDKEKVYKSFVIVR